MKVCCVSNLSMGYGTPQMVYMLRSVAGLVGDSRPTLFEADQQDHAPCPEAFPDLNIARMQLRHHIHSVHGIIEYTDAVSTMIRAQRPDILILGNFATLPVLYKIGYRPKLVIFYALEMLQDATSHLMHVLEPVNRSAPDMIDVVVYPEERRAATHQDTFNYRQIPSVILYNAPPIQSDLPAETSSRNGRLLCPGTLHQTKTMIQQVLSPSVHRHPIDMYGLLYSEDYRDRRFQKLARSNPGQVRYHGYVHNRTLRPLWRQYLYTLVLWAPITDNERYACPNKFFESLAYGVPVICTPSEQCRSLLAKYPAGVLLSGYSASDLDAAIQYALSIVDRPAYPEMVSQCRIAHRTELNWECQFDKLRPILLEKLFGRKEVACA